MSKKKPSVPKTEIKGPKFIRFSKVQQKYLEEVRERVNRDLNQAVLTVYEELGIVEEMKKAPMKYRLRNDFTGLDVVELPKGDN